ncbi:MAG: UPF0280 family protein [Granulosicoccaceae bacterium]
MPLFDLPLVNRLANKRLQLRHGPIDLIIEAFGSPYDVEAAYQQAVYSFSTVLKTLAGELSELRKPSGSHIHVFQGKIANVMDKVAREFSTDHFVTPMIAVAGAVADHVLHSLILDRVLSKAYVNNGGDIAIYLSEDQSFNVGVCAKPHDGVIVSKANILSDSGIHGIATSGWRGRSHSLGIADSVTVLACNAAVADAAATLIANAVDLPNHPMIKRTTATQLNPDSDLGDRMVTVDVGALTLAETQSALDSGKKLAHQMIDSNQIIGVYGRLNSEMFSLHPSLPSKKTCEWPRKPQFDNVEKEQALA